MKSDLIIELMEKGDKDGLTQAAELLEALSQLHTVNVPEFFDPQTRVTKTVEYVEELLKDQNSQVWVARADCKVVGVLYGIIKTTEAKPGWRARRFGYIDAIIVDPKHRQAGVATKLLDQAQSYFKSQGLETVDLNVWAFNKDALKLYDSLGYEQRNINMWRRL